MLCVFLYLEIVCSKGKSSDDESYCASQEAAAHSHTVGKKGQFLLFPEVRVLNNEHLFFFNNVLVKVYWIFWTKKMMFLLVCSEE